MKNSIYFLLIFYSSRCFALSDLDRGVMWYANTVSMGTYIASTENKIAEIKMQYAKKLAETQLAYEKDRQAYLKVILQQHQQEAKSRREFLVKELNSIKARNEQFNVTVKVAQDLFRGLLKKEALANEIEHLNSIYPGVQKDWDELMKTAVAKNKMESLSSEDFEVLLLQALDFQSQSSALQSDIEEQIAEVDTDIQSLSEKLKESK
ncbi:MAG: hypothetical protein ACXVCN_13930 [Bdellovibrio sp.]